MNTRYYTSVPTNVYTSWIRFIPDDARDYIQWIKNKSRGNFFSPTHNPTLFMRCNRKHNSFFLALIYICIEPLPPPKKNPNKMPMGHIAHLSTTSQKRAIVATLIPYCGPTQPSEWGFRHYLNKLKSTPYQKAFR